MNHWTEASNLADVLALGPRTAGQLMQLGLRTAGELLAANSQAVAQRLGDTRFDAAVISQWQRETKLRLEMPALVERGARVLAVLGIGSAERLAQTTPTELLALLDATAAADARLSWLSESPRPTVTEVNDWIRCAQQQLGKRAA